MAKVTIKREGGLSIEADLSFDEIKELMGVNGTSHAVQTQQPELFAVPPVPRQKRRRVATRPNIKQRDFAGYYHALSTRAKSFLDSLSTRRNGISAEELAPILGFSSGNQIGGLTGPGVVKPAAMYGISAGELYSSVVTFPNGKRTRMFFPGKLLLQEKEKPAV
jgi:hypothetical protein